MPADLHDLGFLHLGRAESGVRRYGQLIADEARTREGLDQFVPALRRALLVLHSPQDNTVSVDHAAKIYGAARHPKSFVSLDGADHLLSRPADARYVGAPSLRSMR